MASRLDMKPTLQARGTDLDRLVPAGLAIVDREGISGLTTWSLARCLGTAEEAVRPAWPGRAVFVDLLVEHVNGLVLDAAAGSARTSSCLLACHRRVWSGHRRLIAAHRAGVIGGPNEDEVITRMASALDAEGAGGASARATARYRLLRSLVET